MTWWDVQKRLLAAQSEYMMCIHKEELTELDVHHRILRYQNDIMIACLTMNNHLCFTLKIDLLQHFLDLTTTWCQWWTSLCCRCGSTCRSSATTYSLAPASSSTLSWFFSSRRGPLLTSGTSGSCSNVVTESVRVVRKSGDQVVKVDRWGSYVVE